MGDAAQHKNGGRQELRLLVATPFHFELTVVAAPQQIEKTDT